MTPEEYDALSPEARAEHDRQQREKEAAEQGALPYTWKQQLDHLELAVPVPPGTKARGVSVSIKSSSLSVGLKGQQPILHGQLPFPIRNDDSTWTIQDAQLIEIHLEKQNQNQWWPHVLTHHPKIDTTKIVPENSKLSDLDPETRAMVEKMMFDNRQKAMNKPTSDQLQQQQMLAKLQAANPDVDFSQAKFT